MDKTIQDERLKYVRIALVVVLTVLVVIFASSQDLGHLRDVIGNSGWYGPAIAVFIYGLLGASPIPCEPITLFMSATYGPFVATIVAGLGNLLAALVEYVIGRSIGAVTDAEKSRQKLPFGLSKVPLDSPIFLIGARMIPLYAPKIVSLLSGAYHISIWRYLWTTAVVTFAGGALLAYGGYGIFNLF
jgi:uncharacterized membrane protein YdjX (TVP38/TMEM64 family)